MNNKIKNIFSIFILSFILYQNTISYICSINYECNKCDYCGEEEINNYTACNYYNMFCRQYTSYFDYYYSYSSFLKREYTDFFESNPLTYNFCGEKEYTVEDEKEVNIFSSNNKIFVNDIFYHCHYIINVKENSEAFLSFKLFKNEESNELRNLNFEITTMTFFYGQEKEEIQPIYPSNLRSYRKEILLESVKKIEIFLDFLEKDYKQPEEILEIKINDANSTISKKSSSSSSLETALGSIAGSILAIGLVVFIVYYFCGKKEVVKETTYVCRIF